MAAIPEVRVFKDKKNNVKYIGVIVIQSRNTSNDPDRPAVWQLWDNEGELVTWGRRPHRHRAMDSIRKAAKRRIYK